MIKVQIAREFKELKVNLTGIKELVKTVCSRFNLTDATVGIVIVDDTAMAALNKDFLQLISSVSICPMIIVTVRRYSRL